MNLRNLSLVIGLLALVSAAVFFANRPRSDGSVDPRIGTPLVERSIVEQAARLKLSDQGKTVELMKQSDGSWNVVSYYDFPADFSKLSTFVDELLKSKVERFVSARPDRISTFGFKDTQISLSDASGKEIWALSLGKTTESGSRLFRFLGEENKAYMSRLNLWLDTDSKSWADSSLGGLKSDDVSRIEILFPDASAFVAKRSKKEEPFAPEKLPEGKRFKEQRIASILNSLAGLRFSETSALDDSSAVEARKNERRVKLTTFDGRTLTVSLGRKPEQKILKVPAPQPKGAQEGPAAAFAKMGEKAAQLEAAKASGNKEEAAKTLEPLTETIPAGPVFARVESSDTKAAVNALMTKRAFMVYEFAFTSLPQSADEFFEPMIVAPAQTQK